jgi:hypothetical protein
MKTKQTISSTLDVIPFGIFCGDEIPPGTFHGDEIPPGTFHGVTI